MGWKPQDYPDVAPYLVLAKAQETVEFCTKVFNAVEVRRQEGGGGTIRHTELRIGDSVVMLADATPGWPPVAGMLHIYVADVDEVYRRAVEAGAESLQEPTRNEDMDRRAGVRDANGTSWWFATQQPQRA